MEVILPDSHFSGNENVEKVRVQNFILTNVLMHVVFSGMVENDHASLDVLICVQTADLDSESKTNDCIK